MTVLKTSVRGTLRVLAPLVAGVVLAACASDGGLIETSSIAPTKVVAASVDPQCVTLAQQIETLRGEGSTARLEKAAEGKSGTAVIKRTALQKQSQLNKANADFIAACGPNLPKSAATPAVAPAVAAPAAVKTAAAVSKAATSGVTVVAPVAAQPKQ